MYSAVPEGSLPLRLNPTFAKANATSATAKTSMISSVRRLLGPTSGSSGSTAGDGAVMPLTSVLRSAGPGRHWRRCRTPGRAGTWGRLFAAPGWAGRLVHRLVVLPGQGHGRLVLVVQRDPGLQRGVLLLARVHGDRKSTRLNIQSL